MRTFTRALQLAVASSLGLPLAFVGCEAELKICESPEENATGFATCSNGLVTRPTATTCESDLPRPTECGNDPEFDQCASDADCTEQAHGVCSSGFDAGCYCQYGCVSDDECGAGQICVCGEFIGSCQTSDCTTDADCGEGHVCAVWHAASECGGGGFACTTDEDTCVVDDDCEGENVCTYEGGARVCAPLDGCAIGRPFLVDEAPRLARVAPRGDWQSAPSALYVDIDETTRFALAERWTEIALMEHASIAAFARFAMQLLALGAPADLVAKTAKAMSDETRHAELAFGMASSLRGRALGPGPLSLHHALDAESTPETLLRNVFREGCVGETIAALEAREGAEQSRLGVLFQIAADESDHACLAWAAVKWLVEQMGEESADILEEELAHAEAEVSLIKRAELDLSDFGHLTSEGRAKLRAHALGTLVRPATEALVARIRDSFEPPPATERVSMQFM